jgi:hypothetical protein
VLAPTFHSLAWDRPNRDWAGECTNFRGKLPKPLWRMWSVTKQSAPIDGVMRSKSGVF